MEALTSTQKSEKILERVEMMDPVGEDAKKIPAALDDPISDFEEVTSIPNPPPIVISIRHSKRLSAKRGGQDYCSG